MKAENTYQENSGSNKLPKSLCVNPFIIPTGYFDELSQQTLSLIKLEVNFPVEKISFTVPEDYFENQASDILRTIRLENNLKKDTFSVSQDYFQTSADQIMNQVKIDALKDSHTEVPAEYFTSLTSKILDRIAQPELSIEKKDTGFCLPADYFQQAQHHILSEIAAERLKEEKGNETGFAVPAGYFDSLATSIRETKDENKVIQLPEKKQPKYRKIAWYSAVAAACTAAFIVFSTFYSENEPIVENEILSLNEIPEDEIINYLAKYSDASDLTYIAEYIYQPEDSKGIGSEVTNEILEDYLNYTL